MKVEIAGYNLDKSLIDKIENQQVTTPETISAAYARISRSKKSVTELRQEAIRDVEKARKSNENIVFEMGHSSISEHAVFNFDLIGISRFLVEYVERSRLVSFTEKSQRYVTLKGDFVIPEEIVGKPEENIFSALIEQQNNLYTDLYKELKEYLQNKNCFNSKKDLANKAKEDARYVLSLATQTQLGMTINARNLSNLLRRLDRLYLKEATRLKTLLEKEAKAVSPSLIRYTQTSSYEKDSLPELSIRINQSSDQNVKLIYYTPEAENKILSALAFEQGLFDFEAAKDWTNTLNENEKAILYKKLFSNMKSYHKCPRAFELVYFLFEIKMSASCFAQFKRHRICTILRSQYHPQQGYIIPALIREINREKDFNTLMTETEEVFYQLENIKTGLGNYALTNAHKVSVLMQVNLRELYHFSRLRSDSHAQWEIREISQEIDAIVKSLLPHAAGCLMGKDQYEFSQRTD